MFYPTLFENPNAIYDESSNLVIDWYKTGNIPFSYYNNTLSVGQDGDSHQNLDPYGNNGGRGPLSGRIFVDQFIITFWDFPEDQEELQKLINDLSLNHNSNHLDFSDPRWKIEIPYDKANYNDDIPSNIVNWGSWLPNEKSQIFVSLKDYNGSTPRSKEELSQQHILSPIEKQKHKSNKTKGFGSDRTGWDSKRNIKVRQSEMTSEDLSAIYYPVLFENPNAVYLPDAKIKVNWSEVRSLAFSYYSDIMYVGSTRMTHIDLYNNLHIKDELAKKRNGRGKYAGRLYMAPRIITFWEFPETKEILDQLLKDIEEETNIHFDNKWVVEIPNDDNKPKDNKVDWGTWNPGKNSQIFIPINKYVTGPKRSEEELKINHIQNPIEKEKQKKNNTIPKGFGSDRTGWDSKRNIKVRQAEMTSESNRT